MKESLIFLNFITGYLKMIFKVINNILRRFAGIHLTGHVRKIKEIKYIGLRYDFIVNNDLKKQKKLE